MTKHTKNYEFVDVEARIGRFLFKHITIISIEGESPTHKILNKNSGNFCSVYHCECERTDVAFKCFEKTDQSDLNVLEKAIEEYCVLRLASHLRVGPKAFDALGFGIVVYAHCVEFAMESCESFPANYVEAIDSIDTQLRQNLLRLHALRVVHHDIKVENLCFSSAFGKFVLIDFGMGRVLSEGLGSKSLTHFRGTIDHVSKDMAELYR